MVSASGEICAGTPLVATADFHVLCPEVARPAGTHAIRGFEKGVDLVTHHRRSVRRIEIGDANTCANARQRSLSGRTFPPVAVYPLA